MFLLCLLFPVKLCSLGMLGDSGRLEEGERTSSCLLLVLFSFLPERVFLALAAVGSVLQLLSTSWNQPPGIPQRCPHQPVLPWEDVDLPARHGPLLRGPPWSPWGVSPCPSEVWVPALWVSSSELPDSDNPIPPLIFLALVDEAASCSYCGPDACGTSSLY